MFLLLHPNAPSASPGTPGDAPGTILSPGRRSGKGPKTRYLYDAAQNRVFGFYRKTLCDRPTFQDWGGGECCCGSHGVHFHIFTLPKLSKLRRRSKGVAARIPRVELCSFPLQEALSQRERLEETQKK